MEWIDSHSHLYADFQYSELDKIAELYESKVKIWLHAIEGTKRGNYRYPSAGNKDVLEVSRHYKGLFIPFAFVDLAGKPEQIDRFADEGFAGLKFIYPPADYDDPRFMPFYERANALKMPCFFHTGIIARRRSCDFIVPGYKAAPRKMMPSMLDTIAAEFPDLKLVSGHMAVPWCNELFETLWFYRNVRCSVCGLADYKWLIEHLDNASEDRTPYYKKMMFGTDLSYGRPMKEVGDWLANRVTFFRLFFDEVGNMYHWGDGKDDFMWKNAMEFLPEKDSGQK